MAAAVRNALAPAELCEKRGSVNIASMPSGTSLIVLLHTLRKRDDIKIDSSVISYLAHTKADPDAETSVLLMTYDVLRDAGHIELLQELGSELFTPMWHALALLDEQMWGEEGELLNDGKNAFHLEPSLVLVIKGKPRHKRWCVTVTESRSLELNTRSRLFRRE